MRPMPNKPRPENPAHAIRIEDELWERVKARAVRDAVNASEVVRAAIAHYLKETP